MSEVLGTPAYMSPEQALGKEIDFRSDIYSLAVVAYSLVCGELPFAGKPSELLEYHRRGNPPPPASIHKVPGDVSDAILAGLALPPLPPSSPRQRPQTHSRTRIRRPDESTRGRKNGRGPGP